MTLISRFVMIKLLKIMVGKLQAYKLELIRKVLIEVLKQA